MDPALTWNTPSAHQSTNKSYTNGEAKLAARNTETHSPDKKGPAAEATPAMAAAERRNRSRSPRPTAIAHASSHREQSKNSPPPPTTTTVRLLSAGLREGVVALPQGGGARELVGAKADVDDGDRGCRGGTTPRLWRFASSNCSPRAACA